MAKCRVVFGRFFMKKCPLMPRFTRNWQINSWKTATIETNNLCYIKVLYRYSHVLVSKIGNNYSNQSYRVSVARQDRPIFCEETRVFSTCSVFASRSSKRRPPKNNRTFWWFLGTEPATANLRYKHILRILILSPNASISSSPLLRSQINNIQS